MMSLVDESSIDWTLLEYHMYVCLLIYLSMCLFIYLFNQNMLNMLRIAKERRRKPNLLHSLSRSDKFLQYIEG